MNGPRAAKHEAFIQTQKANRLHLYFKEIADFVGAEIHIENGQLQKD